MTSFGELTAEIARRTKVVLSQDDPIVIISAATDIVLGEHRAATVQMLTDHRRQLRQEVAKAARMAQAELDRPGRQKRLAWLLVATMAGGAAGSAATWWLERGPSCVSPPALTQDGKAYCAVWLRP